MSVDVAAPPEAVYRVVGDVTRTGEWSPECRRCVWIGGADGPAVGARFRGRNRRGFIVWGNKPTVIVHDPPREFAFETPYRGRPGTRWRYGLVPTEAGTRLTESYEVVNTFPRPLERFLDGLMGIRDRDADLRRGMQTSLERIREIVEREWAPTASSSGT